MAYRANVAMSCGSLTPSVRRVNSRIRSLNFSRAFAAICRVGSASFEIVNPRNFRSPDRATALFDIVDLELRPCRQEATDARHDALSRPAAAYVEAVFEWRREMS